eukprot:tig00000402_g200.t1
MPLPASGVRRVRGIWSASSALGALRLSRHRLLVKRIRTAGTLSAVSTIVCDKTGTLTTGALRLVHFLPAAGGGPPRPAGALADEGPVLAELLRTWLLSSALEPPPAPAGRPCTADEALEALRGASTVDAWDRAVLETVRERPEAARAAAHERAHAFLVDARPFEAASRYSSASWKLPGAGPAGAAPFSAEAKAALRARLEELAAAGERCLGLARVEAQGPAELKVFVGAPALVGASEPPDSLAYKCVGELEAQAGAGTLVWARSAPLLKAGLVAVLQRRGAVCAMGDGDNAPALRTADVGVAVRGAAGAAREAAGVELAEDSFAGLVAGVAEGRRLFDNLRKGTRFYLACKAALVALFAAACALGLPPPLAPIQVIALEALMDLAAGAAFVCEPPEPGIMRRPPRPRDAPFVDRPYLASVCGAAALLAGPVFAAFLLSSSSSSSPSLGQSAAFASWLLAHVALALVTRSGAPCCAPGGLASLRENSAMGLWALAALASLALSFLVPPLRDGLKLTPLPAHAWGTALCAALLVLVMRQSCAESRRRAAARSPGGAEALRAAARRAARGAGAAGGCAACRAGGGAAGGGGARRPRAGRRRGGRRVAARLRGSPGGTEARLPAARLAGRGGGAAGGGAAPQAGRRRGRRRRSSPGGAKARRAAARLADRSGGAAGGGAARRSGRRRGGRPRGAPGGGAAQRAGRSAAGGGAARRSGRRRGGRPRGAPGGARLNGRGGARRAAARLVGRRRGSPGGAEARRAAARLVGRGGSGTREGARRANCPIPARRVAARRAGQIVPFPHGFLFQVYA